MAGINQHFIPQSLLRRFGHRKKGKATRVAVYERGNVFVTATTGAAAERYFYSERSQDGKPTLDDKITEYEPQLAALLSAIDAAADCGEVDPAAPAELIAHLCGRTAQVRESFGHITGRLLNGAVEMFTDPVKRYQMMGLDKPAPTGVLLEEFNKLYNTTGMALRGMPRDRFVDLCFAFTKMRFDPSAPPMPEIDAFASAARQLAPSMARDGQGRALERSLVPEARMIALRELAWRVQDTDFDLLLPDCVAIDWPSPDRFRAFVYCPNAELANVFMPVTSRRYLVGARDERTHDVSRLNRALAQCSWRFFIARDRAEHLEALVPLIGTATREWADREIDSALLTAQADEDQ